MTSDPKVTIVTPSYNQGHFIRATIESVLSQDYPAVEYIVMDGGSTDETASVVKDYGSRLTFISKRDNGQSQAINEGFRKGRGEILAWINSDDLFLPGAISTAVRAFHANPNCGMVYGEGYIMDRDGNREGRFPHSQPFDLWRLVHLCDYILQQATFFDRAALNQVGYLDESLHYGMDWDIFIRIGMKFPVCYIPEYLGCIRVYNETKSSSGGLVRARELHRLLRKHTGMRLPPGSIVYGGETYWRLWQSWLEQRTPKGLRLVSRAAQVALQLTAGAIIGHTSRHAQGLYPDGWAADQVQLMLRGGEGSFVISGHIPPWAKKLAAQRLTIRANGQMLGQYAVPTGDFELCVPAPRDSNDDPLRIEVAASRFLRSEPFDGAHRRVAFQLKDIHWLKAASAVAS
ncbi:MAG: glycosyltransferase [Bryobacteraceae bacterium]